jgi:hypothetical protein
MQGNVEAEPSLAFQIAHCHTFRKNDSNVPPVPAHGSTMTNTILVYTWTSCRLPVRHRLTRQTKRLTILAHLCRNTITSDEHVPPFQEGNKLRLEFHEGTTSDGQPRGAHSRHSSPTPSLSTVTKDDALVATFGALRSCLWNQLVNLPQPLVQVTMASSFATLLKVV